MKIIGRNSEAIVYAKVIEESAVIQIKQLCDQEFTRGSKIRIMPDVHAGKGCTIGLTMADFNCIVPNIVGVDIGCGMYTCMLSTREIDVEKLDRVVHTIPSGKNIWEGRQMRFDLTRLQCYRFLKDSRRLERALGTLGGGNHFIEIDKSKEGIHYLVIHSGSRNLGKQVAEYYQNLAIALQQGWQDYDKQRQEMIADYKNTGRKRELHEALKTVKWEKKPLTIPSELCFLYGTYQEDYLKDIALCQSFAATNREMIAKKILDQMEWETEYTFHTVHNYIDTQAGILRKGAISARKGEKVLIPINMRDGSILAVGKGNKEWNDSAPHGAGRILSREQAKKQLSLEEYQRQMEGIYSTSVTEATLDEAPMAYKAIEDIWEMLQESVDVLEILKPIYNFKA